MSYGSDSEQQGTVVTIETIYMLIAPLTCDQACIEFQWLL